VPTVPPDRGSVGTVGGLAGARRYSRPAFRPVSFAIVGRYVREEGDFDIRKGGRLEEMSVSL